MSKIEDNLLVSKVKQNNDYDSSRFQATEKRLQDEIENKQAEIRTLDTLKYIRDTLKLKEATFKKKEIENEELNKTLQNEKLKMLLELEEKSKEIKEKNKKIQEIERLNISSKNKAVKLETNFKKEKDKFAVEMREVNEKLDQASIQIRTFEEEVLCYKKKANKLQNENNQLVIQKDALENAVLENEKLNMALHNEKLKMLQELKEQSKDIEEKNRMIQIIEGLNISITYKTTKLETRCKTKENELNSLQLENKQLAIQKDALENEKQEIKTEYISLKNYAVKLETHYKEQKDKFAVEMREVNEKLDQASIQIRTFEEEVLCYKEKANTLHNENKKLKADKFRYFLRLILLSGKPDGSLDCDPKENSQLQDYEASSDSIYFTPQKFDDSNL